MFLQNLVRSPHAFYSGSKWTVTSDKWLTTLNNDLWTSSAICRTNVTIAIISNNLLLLRIRIRIVFLIIVARTSIYVPNTLQFDNKCAVYVLLIMHCYQNRIHATVWPRAPSILTPFFVCIVLFMNYCTDEYICT